MGKSQVTQLERDAKDPTKPAASWVGSRVKDPELIRELEETANDMYRARERQAAKANKVSKFLNETFYRCDKTWPWFSWPVMKHQLSVKMYFPKKNLAVDQFRNPTDYDRKCVEFKKQILKEHKINYVCLFPENRLLDLMEYIK